MIAGKESQVGETIRVETRGNYAVITLNRPEKLNSFNDAMHLELRAALSAAGADDTCRAVTRTSPLVSSALSAEIAACCPRFIASLKYLSFAGLCRLSTL